MKRNIFRIIVLAKRFANTNRGEKSAVVALSIISVVGIADAVLLIVGTIIK